jgi:hypothetical protein
MTLRAEGASGHRTNLNRASSRGRQRTCRTSCEVGGPPRRRAASRHEYPAATSATSKRRPQVRAERYRATPSGILLRREPWQTHSLKGGPDRLLSSQQPIDARQLDASTSAIRRPGARGLPRETKQLRIVCQSALPAALKELLIHLLTVLSAHSPQFQAEPFITTRCDRYCVVPDRRLSDWIHDALFSRGSSTCSLPIVVDSTSASHTAMASFGHRSSRHCAP